MTKTDNWEKGIP